ncbi:MAG: DNA-directed RNA polymerase subunit N [Candidatus Heimdallarchaeota archaeon]|nr:DNA-directed RNA polymerase subunit N [Candidatus Heimdallarchaeota archaeon]
MIIPVRCLTCGFIVGDKYEPFLEGIAKGEKSPRELLDELGLKKICCRRMVISQVDLVDIILPYSKD